MLVRVIVPAYNEERYLRDTLTCIQMAVDACPCPAELIVVNNASTDGTAGLARSFGATVVDESVRNIARVRNTGAHAARGDTLVFVDADTLVPPRFLARIVEEIQNSDCLGGAADIKHSPSSWILRSYLKVWRWIGIRMGMAQGAALFVRRSAFDALGGYDEAQFMGEDVDLVGG